MSEPASVKREPPPVVYVAVAQGRPHLVGVKRESVERDIAHWTDATVHRYTLAEEGA